MHVAPNQVLHSNGHVDRTTRSAKDCSAVVVNLIHKPRCEHHRLWTARGIKTLITASKPEDFRHSVGVMELEEKSADHVIQAWTDAAACYDAGARLCRIEKQLRARSGELKQLLSVRRCRQIAYDLRRNSCLFTNRVPQWRGKTSLTERSYVHEYDFNPKSEARTPGSHGLRRKEER